ISPPRSGPSARQAIACAPYRQASCYPDRGGISPLSRWRIAAPRASVTFSRKRPAKRCFPTGWTRSACHEVRHAKNLPRGDPVVLAEGRSVTPEMVQGPKVAGAKLAIIGDVEEVASLVEPVRRADVLVIEATFLERDAALARSRGHLTAAAAAQLARE